jgi:hypothetical protein
MLNIFTPNPSPATLYDIENQYLEYYDDDDNDKGFIILIIKKLLSF